jgi:hypothetical protein
MSPGSIVDQGVDRHGLGAARLVTARLEIKSKIKPIIEAIAPCQVLRVSIAIRNEPRAVPVSESPKRASRKQYPFGLRRRGACSDHARWRRTRGVTLCEIKCENRSFLHRCGHQWGHRGDVAAAVHGTRPGERMRGIAGCIGFEKGHGCSFDDAGDRLHQGG